MTVVTERYDDGFEYDAFISYRHVASDRKWAEWLIDAFERYRVPKSLQHKGCPPRLRKVFRDEDEDSASADLRDEIKRALRASRFLIVVCSPASSQSQWAQREIELFNELGRGSHVLALLTDGEPRTAFPPALLERHFGVDDRISAHERNRWQRMSARAKEPRISNSNIWRCCDCSRPS